VPRKLPPATTFSLDGFYQSMSLERCIEFAWFQIGRIAAEERDLPPFQRRLLEDLSGPLDEVVLAEMHDYWRYDQAALFSRNQRQGVPRPARPRIDVFLEITSKGNFKAEWYPRGLNRHSDTTLDRIGSDFTWWMRFENRNGSFDSRPSNEFFFLHGIDGPLRYLRHQHPSPRFELLDHVLLRACEAAVERLKYRLEHSFDVCMKQDVFTEWAERKRSPQDWFGETRLISWQVDDPVKRRAEAELAELAQIEHWLGVSERRLLEVCEELSAKRATGPTPIPQTLPERAAKRLKQEGGKATKGKVERALGLIRAHREDTIDPSNVAPLVRN
jgi:hypothetical protein